jgi:RecA-family ATPase
MDAADLLAERPTPIDWLVEGVLPAGTVGDIYSAPGVGKTALVTSLCLSIAYGAQTWFGHRIACGSVWILGGEKSTRATWVRDLHRLAGPDHTELDRERLTIAPATLGPLWAWERDRWVQCKAHKEVRARARDIPPVLTVADTIGRVALGQNPIDIPQQQLLALHLEELQQEIGGTLLTISHTNQSSSKDDVPQRLYFESRAGANGIPGHLRWLMGITQLRQEEVVKRGLVDTAAQALGRIFLAAGVSKHNEMPAPKAGWTCYDPAIFEMTREGRLAMTESATQKNQKAVAANKYRNKKVEIEVSDDCSIPF